MSHLDIIFIVYFHFPVPIIISLMLYINVLSLWHVIGQTSQYVTATCVFIQASPFTQQLARLNIHINIS
jgi:hypothetical protein